MTVARMCEEMTSDELVYWMAYSELQSEDMRAEEQKQNTAAKVKRKR